MSGGGLKKEKGKGKEKREKERNDKERSERKAEKEKRVRTGEKRDRGSMRKRDDDGAWESDEEEKLSRKRAREEEDEEWRRREEQEQAEDDEGRDASPRPTPPPDETEEERRQRERLEDLAERDAFAARIRDKDKDKTKKLVTDRSSVANESEAAKRRALAEDAAAREAAMPDLRQRSRQEYLQKREAQQMDLLRLEIIDEENLFHGQRMSKREEKELARKKEVLRIMEERQKIDDGYDGYQLPDDYITEQGKIDSEKKKNALYKRYDDNKKDEKSFVTDVDAWERSQADKVSYKTGAQDKVVIEDDYEFVFDESQQISWVSDGVMKGGDEMSAKDKLLQAAIAEAETKGVFLIIIIIFTLCVSVLTVPLQTFHLFCQPSRLLRFENHCRSTPTEMTSFKPSTTTRSSSSRPKPVQERRHSYPSICTRLATRRTGSKLHVLSLVESPPCQSRPELQKKWVAASATKSGTRFDSKTARPTKRSFTI